MAAIRTENTEVTPFQQGNFIDTLRKPSLRERLSSRITNAKELLTTPLGRERLRDGIQELADFSAGAVLSQSTLLGALAFFAPNQEFRSIFLNPAAAATAITASYFLYRDATTQETNPVRQFIRMSNRQRLDHLFNFPKRQYPEVSTPATNTPVELDPGNLPAGPVIVHYDLPETGGAKTA